jgi:CHAD domain-containing protein
MKPSTTRDRLLRRRVRALHRALPEACRGDAAAVHKARVASRRVREALPVLLTHVPAKKAKRLARGFRRITRALGPVRELDVTLGVLDTTAAQFPDAAVSLQVVARELRGDRERLRQEMLGRLEHVDADRLIAKLDAIAGEPAGAPTGEQSVSRAVVAVRIVRRVRDLQHAVGAAGALYAPEPLHAVRIATKTLRYATELAHELRLLPSRRPLRQLERMQETLGQLHDLQVLVERLASAQALLPRLASPVGEDLARVSRALDDECRRLHAEYLTGRDALMTCVEELLETVTTAPARDVETEPVSTSVH